MTTSARRQSCQEPVPQPALKALTALEGVNEQDDPVAGEYRPGLRLEGLGGVGSVIRPSTSSTSRPAARASAAKRRSSIDLPMPPGPCR